MTQVVVALVVYVAVVAAIGILSTRRSSRSQSEFFMAGRGLGTVALFMALFGTNATSFVLVGIPGWSYHDGIGIFSVNAPIIALGIPLTFWAIGSPARRMAQRLKALTPVELYAKRFDSRTLGLVMFGFFALYTVPYMVQAASASGTMLDVASEGRISHAWGAAGVVAVALFYTSLGGMRGTAWTNVFQGAVFLGFTVGAFFLISSSLGGLSAATEAVRRHDSDLLRIARGRFAEPGLFASWSLVISFTVIAFPHMLARLMAAKDQRTLRSVCRMYPIALLLLWVPAVMIGVWGAAEFPGLDGSESDRILALMSEAHLPAFFGGLGFLAVLAAVMSTLDAQILTLSSMVVRDVVGPLRGGTEEGGVRAGRLFGLALGVLVFVLSQVWTESVGDISRMAFEGYVTLVPALFFGVRWRRFTAAGAIASIVTGNAVLALGWVAGRGVTWLGFTPVFWGFVAGIAAGLLVSLATRPADSERTRAAFGSVR